MSSFCSSNISTEKQMGGYTQDMFVLLISVYKHLMYTQVRETL